MIRLALLPLYNSRGASRSRRLDLAYLTTSVVFWPRAACPGRLHIRVYVPGVKVTSKVWAPWLESKLLVLPNTPESPSTVRLWAIIPSLVTLKVILPAGTCCWLKVIDHSFNTALTVVEPDACAAVVGVASEPVVAASGVAVSDDIALTSPVGVSPAAALASVVAVSLGCELIAGVSVA